jgi:hypothetical protein
LTSSCWAHPDDTARASLSTNLREDFLYILKGGASRRRRPARPRARTINHERHGVIVACARR